MKQLLALLLMVALSVAAAAGDSINVTLPATCTLGDTGYQQGGARPGEYYCSATNTWTRLTSSAGYAGTAGKTLTVSNSLTLAGADGTTITFPSTNATVARTVTSTPSIAPELSKGNNMPLQLTNYQDAFNRVNPSAYLKVMSGSWDARTGAVQVQVSVWADKAAYMAGAKSLWDFSKAVTVDPTSLQSAVEAQVAQDPSVVPLSPTTVV